jgi:hypothetical protein
LEWSRIVLAFRSKGSGRCGAADSRVALVVSPLVLCLAKTSSRCVLLEVRLRCRGAGWDALNR